METMKDDREVSNRELHTRRKQLGRGEKANEQLCTQLGTGGFHCHSHFRLYSQTGITNSDSDPAAEPEVRA